MTERSLKAGNILNGSPAYPFQTATENVTDFESVMVRS